MNITSETPPAEKHPNIAAGIAARFGAVAVSFALQAAVLFVGANRFDWTWAWVYLGISFVSVLINGTIMLRTNPETIAERGHPEETKGWDKVIGRLWGLVQFLGIPLVAALNVRFGWTQELGAAWHWAGAAVLAAGLGIAGWAMIANTYFSTAVRIQSERGHMVCRSGPYRFVRHPGYVGFNLMSFGMPCLLGSAWAFIPGIVAVAFMIVRTSFEDRMLQAELPGYSDYVREVRYRLVPGIW